MTNTEINMFRELFDEIINLRSAVNHERGLVEAEKHKTETSSGLCEKYINDKDKIKTKFTALCHCINGLAINDWKYATPTKCKKFLIGLKEDVEKCIRENDIRFNADGVAE